MKRKIPILYEDPHLLVCCKPVGVLSEPHNGAGMPELLAQQQKQAGKPDFISGVHRLDRNVGGLMVFSRRQNVTGKLIAQVAEHKMGKEYLAILRGSPAQPEAVLEDLLFHDKHSNKIFCVKRMRKGVRDAKLEYRTLAQTDHEGRTLTPDMVLGEERRGLKLVYSTDTRPTADIARHADHADLLILEGMYGGHDKDDNAKGYKHMTMLEAATLAKKAQPKELWLTHYSPSLVRPDEYLPELRKIFPNTIAAKDGRNTTLLLNGSSQLPKTIANL